MLISSSQTTEGAEFRLYDWPEGLSRFGRIWAGLVASRGLNPSLGPDWVDLSLNAHGVCQEARLLVVEARGTIRAAVPLFTRTEKILGVPLEILEVASNLTGYHSSFVTEGFERSVSRWLLSQRGGLPWDAFRLRSAVISECTLEALGSASRELGVPFTVLAGHRSPYLPIRGQWADFLARKSSNFRYNLKRKARRFLTSPDAKIEWFEPGGSDLRGALDRVLDVRVR